MQGYASVPNPGGYMPPPQTDPYAQAPGGYAQAPGGYPQAAGGYPQSPGGYGANPYQAQGYANQPMPPMGVAPVIIPGITYTFVMDPMQELALSTGVLIRQQPQFFEQISGCESPNVYFVFSQSPSTGFKLLFKCKEQSECCQRQCCAASAREFIMDIKHVANEMGIRESFQNSFIRAHKPFKCTCFCLERPEMTATYSQGGELLGRVRQPFTCCDPKFEIYDSSGALKYFIYADCCQCGICCSNNFCGKLSEARFNIYNDVNMTQMVGSIVKKTATLSEMVTSADSYQITFPAQALPNEKLLLIIAGLMIDYQYFEEKAGDNNNNNNNHY